MTPARPLNLPSPSEIRRVFNEPRETPPEIRDFMATIAPMIGDDFITATIAVTVAGIGAMRPDRKIKHLDKLMSSVNFPQEVAREINRVIDRVSAPAEYRRGAERIIPPLHNLAGAVLETAPPFPTFKFTEPMSPLQRLCYDETMASFEARRDDFVYHLGYSLLCYNLTGERLRRHTLEQYVDRVIKHIQYLDFAAGICGVTLHHPSTWQRHKVSRMQLIATLNESEARDAVIQQRIDDDEEVSPARHVLSTVDDLIIEYARRAIRSRSSDLRPLAYWQQVLSNSPFVMT